MLRVGEAFDGCVVESAELAGRVEPGTELCLRAWSAKHRGEGLASEDDELADGAQDPQTSGR